MKKITSFWSFLGYPYGRTSTEPAPRKNLRNQHVNKNQHLARISETNTWTRTGQKMWYDIKNFFKYKNWFFLSTFFSLRCRATEFRLHQKNLFTHRHEFFFDKKDCWMITTWWISLQISHNTQRVNNNARRPSA